MNDDLRVPGKGALPSTPGKLELRRLLLEQFHEDSMDRHGLGNGQVRILSRLLVPAVCQRTHKAIF
jgi:hypothetical protein